MIQRKLRWSGQTEERTKKQFALKLVTAGMTECPYDINVSKLKRRALLLSNASVRAMAVFILKDAL